jgi:coenzyme F420-reducing hydrogenase beta subunit/acetyltransferase-like isoleucine patch superfamily enzyme
MISITNKVQCCGCNACGDACSHDAIRFETDIEGFWYPEVDKEKCIDCGLCEKVCPIINIKGFNNNNFNVPDCYAAIHKNLEIRFDSTSGGLFSACAEKVYKEGGYVGGVVYNEDFSASHFISNDRQDLIRLRSSKYLQSNAAGFYRKIKNLLNNQQKVLICGTPCQIFALQSFLGKVYENLLLIDFICMGVASPKVHRKYIEALEEEYNSKVVYFKAKNKELGWRNLTKKAMFANGKSYYGIRGKDMYSRAYHSHGINRPSCYNCKFKCLPRIADISLGDYWGVEKIAPELDDNIGTSAVIINSEKGATFFDKIKNRLIFKQTTIESIKQGNIAVTKSVSAPKYSRTDFFSDLDRLTFHEIAEKYFSMSKETLKQIIKRYCSYVYKFLVTTQLRPRPVWQFFMLNFLTKKVKSNWRKGHLIYPAPYCVFQLERGSKMILNGNLRFGVKKFRKSKIESRLLIGKGGRMIINGDTRLGYGCDVEVFPNAELVFGGGGGNIGLTLICGEKIHIGSNTYYGRDVNIRDTNGGHTIALQGFKDTNPVIVGNNVWLCSNCALMPGVKIGDGAVISAHSVVVSPIPPRCLAAGTPAKVIDNNILWKH